MRHCRHKFGVRIDGQLHTLAGAADDTEFDKATENGLPKNWVAWHLTDEECNMGSERLDGIRDLPKLAVRWQDAIADANAGRPIGTTGYFVRTM
jgi:hypothetical protein